MEDNALMRLIGQAKWQDNLESVTPAPVAEERRTGVAM
jgi:hypothetical protein